MYSSTLIGILNGNTFVTFEGMERGLKPISWLKTLCQLHALDAGIRDQQLSPRFQSATNHVGLRVPIQNSEIPLCRHQKSFMIDRFLSDALVDFQQRVLVISSQRVRNLRINGLWCLREIIRP
jgi:hypothetical protein